MTGPVRRESRRVVATWVVLAVLAASMCLIAFAYDNLTGFGGVEGFSAFALPLAGMALVTGTVGLVIRLRRPASRVGTLMGYGPVLLLSGFLAYAVGAWRMVTHGPEDTIGGLAAAWGAAAVIPGILVTFPAVALVFPDGRLPGAGWRRITALLVAIAIAGSILTLFAPTTAGEFLPANPLAIPGVPVEFGELAASLSTLALVACVVMAVAAVIIRFRRARGIERQQLKWLVFSVAIGGVLFPISFATDLGPAGLIDLASVVAVTFIPVTIGIAILRYRLYDIDRVVSRTLSYAVITALLAAVFVGTNLVLQGILVGATGAAGGTVTTAVATLVVAGLFQPLRRRVQAPIDRRFNRRRVDGERVAAAFAGHLRDQVDLDLIRTQVVQAAEDAVAPAASGLWLRGAR